MRAEITLEDASLSSRRGGQPTKQLMSKRQRGFVRALAILGVSILILGLLATALITPTAHVIIPAPTPAPPLTGLLATPSPRPEQRDFPRIAATELKLMLDKQPALQLLDNSTDKEYAQAHIKGAKFFPATEMYSRLTDLDKAKPVILYCNCTAEQVSLSVGLRLRQAGFSDVRALTGGLKAWSDAGYPTESSAL